MWLIPFLVLLLTMGGCAHADPMRVVVLSDLNSAYGSTEYDPEVAHVVRRTVDEWRPDLVLIAGDMIAGQRPTLDDDNVRAMWAAFDSVVAGPLRRAGVPLAVTMGNHDGSGHPGHERDRRLAVEYWGARQGDLGIQDGGRYPFYYAFTRGDVFFVVLDATRRGVAAWSSCTPARWARGLAPSWAATFRQPGPSRSWSSFPGLDSVAERTFRVEDDGLSPLDATLLRPRIDGINGHMTRRPPPAPAHDSGVTPRAGDRTER
jgi:hypothetical protein